MLRRGSLSRFRDYDRPGSQAPHSARKLPLNGSGCAHLQAITGHNAQRLSVSRNANQRSAGRVCPQPFSTQSTWSIPMQKIVLTTLFALGLSGAAMAQAATDFVAVDTDLNGGVSLTEAQVAWPDLTEEAFTAADTDGNGELSAEEYDALVAASAAPAAE